MKQRIAIWAWVGMLIAAFWAASLLFVQVTPAEPILWNLAQISCPLVLLGSVFHFGVRFYWAILANAIVYAFAGLSWETLRQALKRPPKPAESHN
jgi:hypothetical protein